MPRPQGEVRRALAEAACRLLARRELVVDGTAVDGVTWKDMAAEAQVGWDVARRTVCNMARAGELSRLGAVKSAGSERWMSIYAPATLVDSAADVGSITQAWRAESLNACLQSGALHARTAID